mgnify:CR=1 FL=1
MNYSPFGHWLSAFIISDILLLFQLTETMGIVYTLFHRPNYNRLCYFSDRMLTGYPRHIHVEGNHKQ